MQRNAHPVAVAAPDHDLTVIIPAYNETHRLGRTLDLLIAFLDAWRIDYRVLVADDGSTDDTPLFTSVRGPRCSTLRLGRQSGKGCAVRTAMLAATGRVVAFTDADLPFRLESLQTAYTRIAADGFEVVFGARDLPDASDGVSRSTLRNCATWVFRRAMALLIGGDVTDTQCGLKAFSRRAALEIFSRATIDGFAFDAEVVLLTYRLRLAHTRIPVTLVNDYGSSLSIWRSSLPMLWDVIQMRRRMSSSPDWLAPRYAVELQADTTRRAA